MTLAHPVAVLPLRRFGLPMAAMVIGSMVPDVPLFLRWSSGYQVSHSYAGVFTVNLIGALVVLYGWNAFVRDALVDLAPDVVRVRLAARHRLSRRQWLLAPAAAVVGLAVVLWAVVADLRSRPADRVLRRRALPAPLLPLVVCAAGSYGLLAGLDRVGGGLHAVAFHSVVQGIVATAAGMSITCLAWLFATRLRAVRVE
jgi:hypothetical protein